MGLSVKKNLPGALLCLAFCWGAAFLPGDARARPLDTGPDDLFFFRPEVRGWSTYGSLKYSLGTRISPAGAKAVYLGDTLDYRNMDCYLPVFSAEARPLKGVALAFEIGDSRFSDGKTYIHNWIDADRAALTFYNGTVWYSPDRRDYLKSSAKVNGTTRLYSADAYFRVYKTSMRVLHDDYDLQHSLELFAGYSWYQDRIRITDGSTLLAVNIYPSLPAVGPIAGLNSSFNMTWQGWRVGFRERTRLSKIWAINCKFAFGPTMSYSGRGSWNRGNYWNPGGFRFRHDVTGQVLEMSAFAEWSFWKRFQFNAGYMAWYYRLTSGEQKTYYANGTESTEQIVEFDAARKGVFTSLSYKF